MAGETAGWQQLATDIMAAFGDAVLDATITIHSQGSYDSASGRYLDTTTDVTTKVKKTKKSRDFISRMGSISNEYEAYLVRGQDFATSPEAGQTLTVGGKEFLIDEVEDLGGVGAVYKATVRIK